MEWIETTFHVRYAETDAMAVVHHAAYIVWFEEGRSHFLRSKGTSYAEFEESGFYLTVSEAQARFIAPARYGQQVTVRTALESLRSRSMALLYEVVEAESGQVLVTGRTKHICITHDERVVKIPQVWRERLLGAGR